MRQISAWLVTWEATNAALIPEKRIAGVFDGRLGAEQVRKMVQGLYATHAYTESDMLAFRIERTNPYKAKFGEHEGIITCGHNPYLYARLVDRLSSLPDGKVTWKERPRLALRKP